MPENAATRDFFSKQSENSEVTAGWTERLDGLSHSILLCERRLELLSTQQELLERLLCALEQEVSPQWLGKDAAERNAP